MIRVVVTGAGGFIGSHLVSFLKRAGYWVRGVDLKQPEFAPTQADEFMLLDLRSENKRFMPSKACSTRMRSPRTWAAWVTSPRITRRFCATTR